MDDLLYLLSRLCARRLQLPDQLRSSSQFVGDRLQLPPQPAAGRLQTPDYLPALVQLSGNFLKFTSQFSTSLFKIIVYSRFGIINADVNIVPNALIEGGCHE